MRRTLIAALIVLALSAALCAVSSCAVGGAVARADALRQSSERAARIGNTAGALQYARALEMEWQKKSRWLELVTAHDQLFNVRAAISDARLCLETHDRDDFLRASVALAAALEQLKMTEALRLMNLF